jgi:hypothetical protein|nr:MAG TPA: hypothetical protein [Caudoviricetes sp.]
MDKREEIKMFVDVSIKYTQSELKECQELLTFLSKNPQIKADAEADEAIEQAHKEAKATKKPEPAAKQEEGGVSWRNTTGGWTTNECTEEETVTEKEPVKEYTEKEVIAASADFIKKNSPEVFKGILSQLGARSVSSMPKEKYAELMEAINAK